ncbi:hypothetical protein [Rhodococcus tibetensis]|uniref:DUF1289 domain-containing protein n=1 Tax=Rhodococcus tibetensis TaxID=2965064 RepID=A0ABT1QFK9_9NOCA|nr:hypothetical protein [Rhodococcus sp. FXJ9.536]MCQ4119860.1 hypothetical protein [Rhodococcus sp. FXJ9.536]
MTAPGLFPDCVLPGCRQPVAKIGDTCDTCRTAFGAFLRPTEAALTATEIAERDRVVAATYAARRT